ncbi:MAG: PKD domain-containing protein, partial [Bacteroidetes bacterium]|nr:PKD domain-containing protein [Bacteroidota bacterium]
MKCFILCIIVLFTGFNVFAQCDIWKQNLIHNAGFEQGSPLPTSDATDFKNLEVWECEASPTPSLGKVFHSPDWFFKSSLNGPHDEHGGSGYVGAGNYELFQQQLFQHNKFEAGKIYAFSMYIIPSSYELYGGSSNPKKSKIAIHFAKKKIKYKANSINWGNYCTDDFWNYDSQIGQSIITRTFDLDDFPEDSWSELFFVFSAPDESYDWIAIEVVEKDHHYDCQPSYILFDDVSIMPYCENTCSCTDGLLGICAPSNWINSGSYCKFEGFGNVSYAKIWVVDLDGRLVHTIFDGSFPQSTIGWDGRNQNGEDVANATYDVFFYIRNDCGEDRFSYRVLKTEDYIGECTSCQPVSVARPPDINCCPEGVVLSGLKLLSDPITSETIIYKSKSTISTEGSVVVPTGSKVLFLAETGIDLSSGFEVEAGADFSAQIQPCSGITGTKGLDFTLSNDGFLCPDDAIVLSPKYQDTSNNIVFSKWIVNNEMVSTSKNLILENTSPGIKNVEFTGVTITNDTLAGKTQFLVEGCSGTGPVYSFSKCNFQLLKNHLVEISDNSGILETLFTDSLGILRTTEVLTPDVSVYIKDTCDQKMRKLQRFSLPNGEASFCLIIEPEIIHFDSLISTSTSCYFSNTVFSSTWFQNGIAIDSTSISLTEPGIYNFEVVTTDLNSCSDTTMRSIRICPAFAEFDYFVSGNGNSILFANTSPANTTTSYFWDFGDDEINSGKTVLHQYKEDGSYFVEHIAIDSITGCSDTAYAEITVIGLQVDFTYTPTVCYPGAIDIVAQITGGLAPYSYSWDFGDSTTSTEENPSHLYLQSGTFDITLIVIDATGYSDTAISTVTVYPPVVAAFAVDSVSCSGDTVQITNFPQHIQLSYNWSFGNGETSTEFSPEIVYADTGNYTIELTVTDQYGCSGASSQEIRINQCIVLPTVSGTLYEHFSCGGLPFPGDTLLLTDADNNPVLTVSPAITDANGVFSFDATELTMLDTNALYGIMPKSGFFVQDTTKRML